MNPQNPLLSDMVVALFNSGFRGWVIAAIVVPVVVIGVMVIGAAVRLHALRKHEDQW